MNPETPQFYGPLTELDSAVNRYHEALDNNRGPIQELPSKSKSVELYAASKDFNRVIEAAPTDHLVKHVRNNADPSHDVLYEALDRPDLTHNHFFELTMHPDSRVSHKTATRLASPELKELHKLSHPNCVMCKHTGLSEYL